MKNFSRLLFFVALASVTARADEQWSLHLQSTVISQEHGSFHSLYSGKNSLSADPENKTSVTTTLFGGAKLWRGAEVYIDPELSGGSGLSSTLGVAGYPNGEIYRVDDPTPKWSLARMLVKQTFGLGGGEEVIESDQNRLASTKDSDRLTLSAGKFSLADFFDDNAYSHDARTQFMNWAFMDNGAWDYAADTRGYTWGFVVDYRAKPWTIKFGLVLEPKEANQMSLDTNLANSRSENFQVDREYDLLGRRGKSVFFVFTNRAHMGNYRDAINAAAADGTSPDITSTRSYSLKYGFGYGAEQGITNDLGLFLRIGWNDGHTETWAFTEIDRTLSVGISLKGSAWSRAQDVFGAAALINGLSGDHADYLRAGGYGFIIGDGKLTNYAPEEIIEIYYLWKPTREIAISPDFQWVNHPAYNADRGPVFIAGARLHAEI